MISEHPRQCKRIPPDLRVQMHMTRLYWIVISINKHDIAFHFRRKPPKANRKLKYAAEPCCEVRGTHATTTHRLARCTQSASITYVSESTMLRPYAPIACAARGFYFSYSLSDLAADRLRSSPRRSCNCLNHRWLQARQPAGMPCQSHKRIRENDNGQVDLTCPLREHSIWLSQRANHTWRPQSACIAVARYVTLRPPSPQ